jgi:hypothetical protein
VGVIFFSEAAGVFVFLGVVLTILGMILISRPDPDEREREGSELESNLTPEVTAEP